MITKPSVRAALCGALFIVLAASGSVGAASKTTKKPTKTTKKPAKTTKKPTGTTPATATPSTAAANTASDTGVTKDKIRVAIVSSDLSGLVKAGVLKGVPAEASDINALRISYYLDKWNAAGGINGRTFEYKTIVWNPADPTSFDKACSEITLDYKPFMVVNTGGGYNSDKIPCITKDGNTFFVGLDPVSNAIFKESGNNLITMAPPSEVGAVAGLNALVKQPSVLPKTAKIAVLRGDNQFQIDAWNAAKKILDANGYNIVYDQVQRLAGLPAAEVTKGIVLSVEPIRVTGATHILNMLTVTNTPAFANEAKKNGLDFKYVSVDISSGGCIAFTASQSSADMDGNACVTSWDNFRINDKDQIKQDTPFEAQCRTDYEEMYKGKSWDGFSLTKSVPGVPWPGVTDASGTKLDSDQSYFECSMMNVVKTGLQNAGSNLTKKTLWDALSKITDFPLAGSSNGKGSFGPNKPFAASQMQFVTLAYNAFTNPKAANGLYGGKCPSPLSCWKTSTAFGWEPIAGTL